MLQSFLDVAICPCNRIVCQWLRGDQIDTRSKFLFLLCFVVGATDLIG